jgi:hypothetical protein
MRCEISRILFSDHTGQAVGDELASRPDPSPPDRVEVDPVDQAADPEAASRAMLVDVVEHDARVVPIGVADPNAVGKVADRPEEQLDQPVERAPGGEESGSGRCNSSKLGDLFMEEAASIVPACPLSVSWRRCRGSCLPTPSPMTRRR